MKYNTFPKTEEKISRLGFGLMRLPKLYENKEAIDRTEAARLVDLAYNNGVNYFDTAYVYHDGESEYFAGEVLKKYPRESYNLATKLPGWAIKSDGKTVDELFSEQLQKCGVDYFDFYLLHSVNREIMETFEEAHSYEYLSERKKEGKIKHLGFSYHGDLEFFKELLDRHSWDFVQLQINYYDWEASDAKSYYHELEIRGIPCIVMEPVRGGSLQTLNDDALKVFSELGNASPASYALRYVASLKNVLVTLSGMSTYEQVEDNLNTFKELAPLSGTEKEAVEKANILFRKNFAVPCTGCKYCIATCPSKIDIPACFAAYNEYNKTRSINDFETAYAKIPESERADNCIKCKKCMEHCPQGIEIPRKLSDIKELSEKAE